MARIEISQDMIAVVRLALRELSNRQLESIRVGQTDGIDALVLFEDLESAAVQ